jgi:predicted transcriptional regulator
MPKKITIFKLGKPAKNDINHELQWLGHSLGLFNIRDKDKSCFRIFIELLKSAKQREPLSSDDIAVRLELTRGTIIHHINNLINAGLVIQEKQRYLLRVEKLSHLIEELHRDLENACKDIKDVARDIDEWLGL